MAKKTSRKTAVARKRKRSVAPKSKTVEIKAVPGNPFVGLEHLAGAFSFPSLKGKAFKDHIRARILADHNT